MGKTDHAPPSGGVGSRSVDAPAISSMQEVKPASGTLPNPPDANITETTRQASPLPATSDLVPHLLRGQSLLPSLRGVSEPTSHPTRNSSRNPHNKFIPSHSTGGASASCSDALNGQASNEQPLETRATRRTTNAIPIVEPRSLAFAPSGRPYRLWQGKFIPPLHFAGMLLRPLNRWRT